MIRHKKCHTGEARAKRALPPSSHMAFPPSCHMAFASWDIREAISGHLCHQGLQQLLVGTRLNS